MNGSLPGTHVPRLTDEPPWLGPGRGNAGMRPGSGFPRREAIPLLHRSSLWGPHPQPSPCPCAGHQGPAKDEALGGLPLLVGLLGISLSPTGPDHPRPEGRQAQWQAQTLTGEPRHRAQVPQAVPRDPEQVTALSKPQFPHLQHGTIGEL